MFTQMKFKRTEFSQCDFTSFLSFIFSIVQLNMLRVFGNAFPGWCGVY